MLDPKKIEQIAEQVIGAIPPGVKNIADNLEDKVKTVIQSKLSQLDVVSREEFDVQTQVLARTRQKLIELEAIVKSLQEQQNKPD